MKSVFMTKLLVPAAVGLAVASSAPANAAEPKPYQKADGSWISIDGTVVSPKAEHFMLDYGTGVITVEMDDWDDYGEAYALMDGDRVTVFGRVDDDLFEVASIEAGSVYVKSLNTFFHASAADEESYVIPITYVALESKPLDSSATTMNGTVKKVDRDEKEFVMDMAGVEITVETDGLGYDPLDNLGFQQIDKGDKVSVTGKLDYEFFDGQVLKADFVTTVMEKS